MACKHVQQEQQESAQHENHVTVINTIESISGSAHWYRELRDVEREGWSRLKDRPADMRLIGMSRLHQDLYGAVPDGHLQS